jgi:hypothetical protein
MWIRFFPRIFLVFAVALLTSQQVWAQLGLQIGIGSYGTPFGGPFGPPPFGVGPTGPGFYGVAPTMAIGPRGRVVVGAPYAAYRGYNLYVPAPPAIGIYNYPTYAAPRSVSPTDYPYSGTGPYSGTNSDGLSNSYSNRDLYNLDHYRNSSSYSSGTRGYAPSSNASRVPGGSPSPVTSAGTPDLRPGMKLPDGSTVLSVDPPRAVGQVPPQSQEQKQLPGQQSPGQVESLQAPTPVPPNQTSPTAGRTAF